MSILTAISLQIPCEDLSIFTILQDLCLQTFEFPPPLWMMEGLNFAETWFFGLIQCSFVGIGVTRIYLIHKVNKNKV